MGLGLELARGCGQFNVGELDMEVEVEDPRFSLDDLPLDCLVCICEQLSPGDLCRFGAACKVDP